LGAENPDQRLQGLLANLRWLSTAHASYPRKITKKLAFNRFQTLSVEIIEEKNRSKVIHSQFISPCSNPRNPPVWTDSGCPDKYMKTQCN
jgi:hypothetical protein